MSGIAGDRPDTGKSGTVDTLAGRSASTTAVHISITNHQRDERWREEKHDVPLKLGLSVDTFVRPRVVQGGGAVDRTKPQLSVSFLDEIRADPDSPSLQSSRAVHGVQFFLLDLKLLLLSPQLDGSLNTLLNGPLPVMSVVVTVLVALLVLVVNVSRLRLGLGLLVLGRLTVRRLGLGLVIFRRLAVRGLSVAGRSSGGFTALGAVVPVVACTSNQEERWAQ